VELSQTSQEKVAKLLELLEPLENIISHYDNHYDKDGLSKLQSLVVDLYKCILSRSEDVQTISSLSPQQRAKVIIKLTLRKYLISRLKKNVDAPKSLTP
jgi:hypothetical protein